MENILYIILAFLIGTIISWFYAKSSNNDKIQEEKTKFNDLEKEFISHKSTSAERMNALTDSLSTKQTEITEKKELIDSLSYQIKELNNKLSTATANLNATSQTVEDKNKAIDRVNDELKNIKLEYDQASRNLATQTAQNNALTEKLATQKSEMEEMGKKFNLEFENIATKILDTKSEKFTELNKTNLKTILEPLGKNITDFKTKVEEVYDKESKERFSLGEKVKELAQLNKIISEEAHNLTRALKSESKTQGGWGEMILENILERSGLVKDREYFMEHQLLDENGVPMRSDSEDKKMRPDAVIKYPDNRNVIIDSKVSLNAFTRFIESDDEDTKIMEINEHIACIKKHIVTLSTKGYDDYSKSLDFVMMFVPSEPAYISAMQYDADLWNFAYEKRILLLSPTNLITSLKLIVDLWKREYQNQNAVEIAERGAKLYDKFVSFVSNLEDVGDHLTKAQGKYSDAFKQLSTGNDNLVLQATKLKDLGLKTKKELPPKTITTAIDYNLTNNIVNE